MLATARMVLAVAIHPDRSFDVGEMAMELGMTVDGVRKILNSPTYQALMSEEIKIRVAGTMTRGVNALDRIIASDKSTDANKISAVRAVTHLFQAMTGMREKQSEAGEGDEAKEALHLLQKLVEKQAPK